MTDLSTERSPLLWALVVDDEEKLGRFICRLLKQAGYHAETCQSIAEARQLLATAHWHIVITDIVIPRENGFDLMRWVQANYPTLPVVAMTAYSTEAIQHQINQSGFAALLQKPFAIDTFYQTVQQLTPSSTLKSSLF